jgi:ABC-type branched-subunit amino acid transport system permease subunit
MPARWRAISDAAARDAILRQILIEASSAFVKIAYAGLFTVVLLIILALCVRALNSPWGRMMRAIRDNEEAAAAMGKDIKARHLQIFVLGSAIIGIAGAMMTTLDGQFTPGTYNPLRFTFLIWVMVIVGGSGNNLGAVLGGFLIWFIWVEAEPAGRLYRRTDQRQHGSGDAALSPFAGHRGAVPPVRDGAGAADRAALLAARPPAGKGAAQLT